MVAAVLPWFFSRHVFSLQNYHYVAKRQRNDLKPPSAHASVFWLHQNKVFKEHIKKYSKY
ncbi:hypothetical protein Cabys_2288 [Caldithrix abyssi DSM 13497]|uniref:Uncharacterized protein n=1 Tax=Caldithrix abyssi DSM 13497 TaxID=880073 RepID=A0A1J1C8L1_CALAY|nr:hypothetical protein Cabys_2288 [Caldithrix abyssi DSM 13497]